MLDHHAYLYRSQKPKPDSVKIFVDELGVSEVEYFEIDNLGIDDVRTLVKKAYVRPGSGTEQLLVVCCTAITVEAQQAMLKILEEPPQATKFLFCLPETLYLLPTLLSRFQVENNQIISRQNQTTSYKEFKTMTVPERITEISNRMTKKDLVWVDEIKSGLLSDLVTNSKTSGPTKLSHLFWLAEHMQTRGASNKLLLEELALSLK